MLEFSTTPQLLHLLCLENQYNGDDKMVSCQCYSWVPWAVQAVVSECLGDWAQGTLK